MANLPQDVQCCIAGGGPAGMMLGLLLARAGVETLVLEKHADFLRDFRGDTVHPSTLEIIYDLGLLEEFLKLPHQELGAVRGQFEDHIVTMADFSHLPTHCRFIAFMPQWDLLNFLARQAERYPTFHLMMQAEVTDLLQDQGTVTGVQVKTPQGPLTIRASLVVGADGRHSVVRDLAGFTSKELGAPIDVVWFRITRHPEDLEQPLGRFHSGKALVMLNRGDHWQCGLVILKGGFDELRQHGLDALHQELLQVAPFLGERVQELHDWDDAKLLTVKVDHLKRWYRPGLLCIGDAAHAMSPVGGVGINLAVQDAVATANLLSKPLRAGTVRVGDLAKVQCRREWPVLLTQRMQWLIQRNVISRALDSNTPLAMPLPFKLLQRWPILQRITGRVLGLGFRPERPDALNPSIKPL